MSCWYYYVEDKLAFPFKAKCVAERRVSPLRKGEEVEVLGLAKEDDCMSETFVLIRFVGRKLGVPLSQVEAMEGTLDAREAVSRLALMGYHQLYVLRRRIDRK